ncbi:Nepenthesin [Bertholletia excelsa]
MDHVVVISCLVLIIFCPLPFQSLTEAKIGGFTIDIIPRHSKLSPFYNHSATLRDRSRSDALRSIARAKRFHPSSLDTNYLAFTIFPDEGQYLMRLLVGNPPVELPVVVDTGSDLVWVQCAPCQQCNNQNAPVFNPMASSAYAELPCNSQPCQSLPESQCSASNACIYHSTYKDGSYTNGVLAVDIFGFYSTNGQRVPWSNAMFGCGYDNDGNLGSGLVGLGAGPLSLISQLGRNIDYRFSYCLSGMNSAGKLKFGGDAILSAPGVVSTPLTIYSTDNVYHYLLTLEGASVGNKKIVSSQMASNEGNIIIDSGTTLTMLESSFYSDLEAVLRETISLETIRDPEGIHHLCYDQRSFSNISEMTVVFHFSGADVPLKKLNVFRRISTDLTCLAMLPTNDTSIYGNWAQINFQVEYDLANKEVSFAPANCAQF